MKENNSIKFSGNLERRVNKFFFSSPQLLFSMRAKNQLEFVFGTLKTFKTENHDFSNFKEIF